MRSVEVEGGTVEEATAAALNELEASIEDVDVEVLRAPRRGIFASRGKAVIRATVRERSTSLAEAQADTSGAAHSDATESAAGQPSREPATEDLWMEEEQGMTEADVQADAETQPQVDLDALTPEQRVELLDEECDLAADFVEGLLDLLDLPGDIEIEVTEDGAVVNVSDVGSGLLIGRRGATLDALQELVRSTTQRQTERRSQVRVDVEGYRARQLEKLRSKCRDAIAEVRETGEPYKLEPMDAYERKMMHDLVARTGGVTSSSEGAEPKRRVVIQPE